MNIEAIHKGDNSVKVTKPMMNNLNKFNTRQLQISEIENQIKAYEGDLKQLEARYTEISAQKNSDDRKVAKEISKELKTIEKEKNSLNSKIDKANAEKAKLCSINQDVLINLPNISIVSEQQDEKANSLTAELNDISFELPNVVEPVANVLENTPIDLNSPVAETPAVQWPEFDYVENAQTENVQVENTQTEDVQVENTQVEDIPRRIPELEVADNIDVVQNDISDYIFDIPVVPIYDLNDESFNEEPKITQKSVNAIDQLINKIKNQNGEQNFEEQSALSEKPLEPVFSEEIPVANEVALEENIEPVVEVPIIEISPIEEPTIEINPDVPEEEKQMDIEKETVEVKNDEKEENTSDEMPYEAEITLKDYVKFPNYQAWLFTFAEEVYDKNSFTKEEILDLENKENFVSERRFNSGRVKQAIALTNENHKLIEKTQQAIVSRNASQTLAKNLTDELNDTKAKLYDLSDKYDTQSNKLADTEKNLQDTKEELAKTKEELDKAYKELENYKTTFNKMRGIMETSADTKNKESNKDTKKQKKEDK